MALPNERFEWLSIAWLSNIRPPENCISQKKSVISICLDIWIFQKYPLKVNYWEKIWRDDLEKSRLWKKAQVNITSFTTFNELKKIKEKSPLTIEVSVWLDRPLFDTAQSSLFFIKLFPFKKIFYTTLFVFLTFQCKNVLNCINGHNLLFYEKLLYLSSCIVKLGIAW